MSLLVCSVGLAVALGSAATTRAAGDLPDDAAEALLSSLKSRDVEELRAAVIRAGQSGDARFTAPLIELLRADEIGLTPGIDRAALVGSLERVSGQTFGDAWPAWVSWYVETDLLPPPGFTGWKGQLLSRIDPRFGPLLATGIPSRIRVEEIVWGGVGYERIPALDDPKMISAEEAGYLRPEEPVFGVFLGGEARAYPLRILDWHEMANDTVGGVPVSLAYCTLCGAGIAYRGAASDGRAYDFGSSGFLMRSNKLMVDRQTQSLWNQFTGKPVLGKLVGSGLVLERVPVVVTRWSDWRSRHPATKVLSLDTGFDRPYHAGAAYAGYFASPETMFPVRVRSRLLPAKERIYGVELGGVPKAYPVDALTAARVTHDRLNDTGLVLIAPRAQVSVDGHSVRAGPATYRAGAPVRVYRSGDRRFELAEDGSLRDGQGRRWRIEEEALIGPGGERLPREVGVLSFWFGWNAYHPNTLVHGAATDAP